MEEEISFSEFLNYYGKILFIFLPMVVEKEIFVNQMIKFTPILKLNSKIVTLEKSDNIDNIQFNQLKEKNDDYQNKFFIINDFELFLHYTGDLFNRLSTNKFIFIIQPSEIVKVQKLIKLLVNVPEYKYLFPKNLDLKVNITTDVRKTYIIGEQLKIYNQDYLKYRSSASGEDDKRLSGVLNIYFDEKIKGLDNLSLDKSLERAPKFKTIILDILTKNKKRHLVNMIDGKYGIDSFLAIYNKIKDTPPIVVIKASDDYNSKIKKLSTFNNNNAPGIILTNFDFSNNMMPKNIDIFHITDGGDNEKYITFFYLLKSYNYSGIYPRDIKLTSHISVSLGNEITLDLEKNEDFMKNFNVILNLYNEIVKTSGQVYLKGNEFYIGVKEN